MAELNASNESVLGKRRSTRIVQAVPITVSGADALGQPFKERTSTVLVNCHGCKYQSKHYVPKNSWVTLEIPRLETSEPPRVVRGRVVWVQRPRTVRELFQIGLEFESTGNVWGIAFPPEDWTPLPEGPSAEVSTADLLPSATGGSIVHSPALTYEKKLEIVPPPNPLDHIREALGTIPPRPRRVASPPPAPPAARVAPPTPAPPKQPASAPPPSTSAGAGAPVPPTPTPAAAAVPPGAPVPAPVPAAALSPAVPAAEMAKEMDRIIAEARKDLQEAARQENRTALADELAAMRGQIDTQLKEAVEQAIESSASRVSEEALHTLTHEATRQAASIVEEVRRTTQQTTSELEAQLRASLQIAVETSAAKAAEQAVRQAAENAASASLQQAVEEALKRTAGLQPAAASGVSPEAVREQVEALRREIEQAAETARTQSIEQIQNEANANASHWQGELHLAVDGAAQKLREVESAAERARTESIDHIQKEANAASARWRSEIETSLSGASQKLTEQLAQASRDMVTQAEKDVAERTSSLRASLDQTAGQTQSALDAFRAELEREQARADAAKNQIQEVAQTTLEGTRQQLQEIAATQFVELEQRADRAIAERAAQLEPALEASARQIFERVNTEVLSELSPQLRAAQNLAAELAAARAKAEESQQALQTQLRDATDGAVRDALARLQQETAEFPVQIDETIRGHVKRAEDEIEAKSTETTHTTFEALIKASDWYTRKAQSGMQASVEKAVEQSANLLHERAAEASRKFASELDHYSRSYVEHARTQMDDVAQDAIERNRERLTESALTTQATFADEVHRLASNTLSQFEEASGESIGRAREQMVKSSEATLDEFREHLDETMALAVARAGDSMQIQLKPLMDVWLAQRDEQQRAWMEHLKRVTNESIDQYKARLENASNSWLLASATTLSQHSQAVIEGLAQSAEKRLRETCSEILASMGDAIHQRLLNMSGAINNIEKPAETREPDETDRKK